MTSTSPEQQRSNVPVASIDQEEEDTNTITVQKRGTPQFDTGATLPARCMRALRWDFGFTARAIRGYRQFMGLKIRLEDWDATKLAAPPIIEQVWQQHILDVNHYAEACSGGAPDRRIHHNPDDGYSHETYAARMRATELALEGSLFGQVDPEIWSFTQPDTNTSSSDDEDNNQEEEGGRSNKRRRRNNTHPGAPGAGAVANPRRTDAITFFVRWAQNNNHQRPNDLYFKIRPDTKMARVFERFNMHWATGNDDDGANGNAGGGGGGGDDQDFTFFFGGKMVRPTDTANTMGLVSDDMINATRCKAVLDTD